MKKTLGLISASLLLVSGSMLAIGARERVVAKAPMKAAEAALEMLSSVELTLNPDGSAELDAKDFTKIRIEVSEQGLSTNAKSLTITNPDGTTQEAALSTSVLAYGAASLSGIVAEKSGEYKLTIPEGTFFDDEYASTSGKSGKRNLLKEVTYTVKAAEGPVGPIEKAEITSAVLTVDGTTYDLTATPSIEKITDGSTIELGLSSDVPQYIQFSLVDVTPDASGQPLNKYLKNLIDIRKNADDKFVYTFPSQLIELATGHTYSFNFTIYDIETPPTSARNSAAPPSPQPVALGNTFTARSLSSA